MFARLYKRDIETLYTRVVMSGMLLAVLAFADGFRVGTVEAGWSSPWMPAAAVEASCWPSHAVEQVPILGTWVRLADEMGYEFADGPETTR
jgi:hypothetical protein